MNEYLWQIIKVYQKDLGDDIGISGPRKANMSLKGLNKAEFWMYRNNALCYKGFIYGDYAGYEPLYDFGIGGAKCNLIECNGRTYE